MSMMLETKLDNEEMYLRQMDFEEGFCGCPSRLRLSSHKSEKTTTAPNVDSIMHEELSNVKSGFNASARRQGTVSLPDSEIEAQGQTLD